MCAWHARLPDTSYLALKRELYLGDNWTLEQALRNPLVDRSQAVPIEEFLKKFEGAEEHRATPIKLDLSEDARA